MIFKSDVSLKTNWVKKKKWVTREYIESHDCKSRFDDDINIDTPTWTYTEKLRSGEVHTF